MPFVGLHWCLISVLLHAQMTGETRNALLHISFLLSFFRSTVRVWTLAGDTVYTLTASTAFIFCLAILPSGNIVTGGEDRAVSVWRGVFYFFHSSAYFP
jgi:WD40 repeat protein